MLVLVSRSAASSAVRNKLLAPEAGRALGTPPLTPMPRNPLHPRSPGARRCLLPCLVRLVSPDPLSTSIRLARKKHHRGMDSRSIAYEATGKARSRAMPRRRATALRVHKSLVTTPDTGRRGSVMAGRSRYGRPPATSHQSSNGEAAQPRHAFAAPHEAAEGGLPPSAETSDIMIRHFFDVRGQSWGS